MEQSKSFIPEPLNRNYNMFLSSHKDTLRSLEKYAMLIIILNMKKMNAGGTIFLFQTSTFTVFFQAFFCTDILARFMVKTY